MSDQTLAIVEKSASALAKERLAELTVEAVDKSGQFMQAMKQTVDTAWDIGRICETAADECRKGKVGYGKWQENLLSQVDISESTIGNFRRLYRATPDGPGLLEKVGPTAAVLLTRDSTPQTAVDRVIGLLEAGQEIGWTEVQGIVADEKAAVVEATPAQPTQTEIVTDDVEPADFEQYLEDNAPAEIQDLLDDEQITVKQAYAITKTLETVRESAPDVAELALETGIVDPALVEKLIEIKAETPALYEEIHASKTLQPTEGEAIPLGDAKPRDLKKLHNEYRSEEHKADSDNKRIVICRGYAVHDMDEVTEDVDGVKVSLMGIYVKLDNLIEDKFSQVGDKQGMYRVTVEFVEDVMQTEESTEEVAAK